MVKQNKEINMKEFEELIDARIEKFFENKKINRVKVGDVSVESNNATLSEILIIANKIIAENKEYLQFYPFKNSKTDLAG